MTVNAPNRRPRERNTIANRVLLCEPLFPQHLEIAEQVPTG